jgi:3-isopropylmalate dehydrogenase (EC 1.1.1.85)
MMLDYIYSLSKEIKYKQASNALQNAIYEVYKEGKTLTPDIGGSAKLTDFIDAIYSKIA